MQILQINGENCIPLAQAIQIVTMYIYQSKGIIVQPILNTDKDFEMFIKCFNIAAYQLNIHF